MCYFLYMTLESQQQQKQPSHQTTHQIIIIMYVHVYVFTMLKLLFGQSTHSNCFVHTTHFISLNKPKILKLYVCVSF